MSSILFGLPRQPIRWKPPVWIGRSVDCSVARSIARSVDRSAARSLGRSVARSLDRPLHLYLGNTSILWFCSRLLRSRSRMLCSDKYTNYVICISFRNTAPAHPGKPPVHMHRSLGRLLAVAGSIVRSPGRSLACSIARSFGRSVGRSIARKL